MATKQYRIVSGEESDIHDEAHLPGSRVTVWDIYTRVEKRGLSPETVADRFSLDIADVYEALAYYHNNPEEMRTVAHRHERANDVAQRESSLTPPDDA